MSERFVKPILALSEGVDEIAGGNLDRKLDIRTGDEIEHLALRFNAMTDELKDYMANLARATAERERVQAELSIAAAVRTHADGAEQSDDITMLGLRYLEG